jgi:pSer/pThr/pTyr-binding forkhead associated (FHA) protein
MPAIRIKLPGNDTESVIPLLGHRITVGRAPNNTLQILSPTMSLRHAELILEGDHYRLRDLGSTNGVFVNNHQVTDFHLREACKLSFGKQDCSFLIDTPTEVPGVLQPMPSIAELDSAKKETAVLKVQLERIRGDLSRAHGDLQAERARQADMVSRDEHMRLAREYAALRQAATRSDEELARTKAELAAMTSAHQELLQRAEGNASRIQDLSERMELYRSENAFLKSRGDLSADERDALKASIAEQAKAVASLRQENLAFAKRQAGYQTQISTLETALAAAKSAHSLLETEVANLTQQLAREASTREVAHHGSVSKADNDRLAAELAALRGANLQAKGDLASLNKDLAAALSENAALKSRFESLASEKRDLDQEREHRYSGLRVQYDTLLSETGSLLEIIDRRNSECEELRKQLAGLQELHQRHVQLIREQESELQSRREVSVAATAPISVIEAEAPVPSLAPSDTLSKEPSPADPAPAQPEERLEDALARVGFVLRPVRRAPSPAGADR